MDVLQFLSGNGLFLLLGILLVVVVIYNKIKSPRIDYTFDVIFKYILGIEYKTIQDVEEFKNHQGEKINYSNDHFSNSLTILPCKDLWDDKVKKINPVVFSWNDLPVFFKRNK